MKFDDLFHTIGHCGPYQACIAALFYTIIGWPSPAVSIVYSAFHLPHWCSYPDGKPIHDPEEKNIWIPFDNKTQAYSQCQRYAANSSTVNNSTTLVTCTSWTYDHSEYGYSVIEKFDLVCDQSLWMGFANTIFGLGMMVGGLTGGWFSDRFGRFPVLLISFILMQASWYAQMFAPWFSMFLIARFTLACTRISSYIGGFVLLMEIVGIKWRLVLGTLYNLSYAVGYACMSGIAYICTDGLKFELWIAGLANLFLLFFFFIPESPRWLLVNKKYDAAKTLLQKIGKFNKKPLPDEFDCLAVDVADDYEKKGTILDLLRTPSLRKICAILSINWVTVAVLYYAFTFNSGALIPGNYYLNNALLALVELPGLLLGCVLSHQPRIGRKYSTCVFLFVPGVCCFFTVPLMLYKQDYIVTFLAIFSKAWISGCFNLMYVYTSELMPTEVRFVGFALCSALGRFGSMFAPYLGIEMMSVWLPLPYVVFGCLGTVSGLLTLCLPDTCNKRLCDKIQEAGGDQRFSKDMAIADEISSKATNL